MADREVATTWRDAGTRRHDPADPDPTDPDWAGGVVYRRIDRARSRASTAQMFATVSRLGGADAWPAAAAWRLRADADRIAGGPGRRARSNPTELVVGDTIDVWRIEHVEPPDADGHALVRLRAEAKLPGQAWLEFEIQPTAQGSKLTQRSLFAPRGLAGRLYWSTLRPAHNAVFAYTAHRIAADATSR